MMIFYINPPKGEILLDKFLHFGIKRLKFLRDIWYTNDNNSENLITSIDSVETSDCLIDGTLKDKISHFLLRVVCAEERKMREFFIRNETSLFNMRLQFYDMESVIMILHKAAKESHIVLSDGAFICDSYKQSLHTLVSVKEQMETIRNDSSVLPEIKVPFLHALPYVEKRLCPVQQGFALIAIDQIYSFLTTLFELILTEAFQQLQSSGYKDMIAEDPRMDYLRQRMQVLFKKIIPNSGRQIFPHEINNSFNLDEASENFPLCMKHLHSMLRKRHRLKHRARIQYVLFLKEIGVPFEVVIECFKKEYSKPPEHSGCGGNCLHSWQKDNKRYIYNIQHLYGKRGSRTNYGAHKCSTLQLCREVAGEEGGCPFACFDRKHLHDTLKQCGAQESDIEDIIELASEKKYTMACSSHVTNILLERRRKGSNCCNSNDVGIKKSELLCQTKTILHSDSIDTEHLNILNIVKMYNNDNPCVQILPSSVHENNNKDECCTIGVNAFDGTGISSTLDYVISCPSNFYRLLSM